MVTLRNTRARVSAAIPALIVSAMALAPIAARADGTTQTYAPGQFGGPAAADWFTAAQGFGSTIAPQITTLIPVMVVLLAIFMGPRILKKLVKMGTGG
jgi:hypothetical protein